MLLAHDISVPIVPAGRFETNNKGFFFPGNSGEHSLLQDIMDGNSLPVQEQSYERDAPQRLSDMKASRLFLYSLRKSLSHKLLKALRTLQRSISGALCHYILPSFLVTGCWFGWTFDSGRPLLDSYVVSFTISTSRELLVGFVKTINDFERTINTNPPGIWFRLERTGQIQEKFWNTSLNGIHKWDFLTQF